jgi:hypothetical protein
MVGGQICLHYHAATVRVCTVQSTVTVTIMIFIVVLAGLFLDWGKG